MPTDVRADEVVLGDIMQGGREVGDLVAEMRNPQRQVRLPTDVTQVDPAWLVGQAPVESGRDTGGALMEVIGRVVPVNGTVRYGNEQPVPD